jgi:hypothetical protein
LNTTVLSIAPATDNGWCLVAPQILPGFIVLYKVIDPLSNPFIDMVAFSLLLPFRTNAMTTPTTVMAAAWIADLQIPIDAANAVSDTSITAYGPTMMSGALAIGFPFLVKASGYEGEQYHPSNFGTYVEFTVVNPSLQSDYSNSNLFLWVQSKSRLEPSSAS